MIASRKRWFIVSGYLSLGVALMASGGCLWGPRNAPVDASKARTTLKTALESWKKGEKIDALQSGSPPIYVVDVEWQSGAKLKEYQIVDEGKELDAHLNCPVKLTIQTSAGKEVQRDVTYVISTAPNLTVSRKLF